MVIRSLIFPHTLNTDCIQPAAMIVGKERVRGFMIAMVILVVLLVFLLLLSWFHNRKGHPHQPEPPLHARYCMLDTANDAVG